MPSDPDMRNLTQQLREMNNSIKQMTRVLAALNDNFAELGRMMKKAQEEQSDGSA